MPAPVNTVEGFLALDEGSTAVFPAGTTNGDLIRCQIPTSCSPAAAAPVTPAAPA